MNCRRIFLNKNAKNGVQDIERWLIDLRIPSQGNFTDTLTMINSKLSEAIMIALPWELFILHLLWQRKLDSWKIWILYRYSKLYPSFRIFEVDADTNQIVNYQQYRLNLTKWNSNTTGPISWDLAYTLLEVLIYSNLFK